jgi:hypothetical protein
LASLRQMEFEPFCQLNTFRHWPSMNVMLRIQMFVELILVELLGLPPMRWTACLRQVARIVV